MTALLCAAPVVAHATPVGSWQVVTQGPADSADPAIDADVVVYSTNGAGDRDVVLWNIGATPDLVTRIAFGPGDQDQPSIHRATVAYRDSQPPAGIHVANRTTGTELRRPDSPAALDPARRCRPVDPVAHPVVSDVLASWVCGSAGSRTVVVARYGGALEEYDLSGSGDVFGASASGALVAYVDASDGSVWLHDSTPASRQTTQVCAGSATGVSLGSLGVPVIAVARASSGADADIEVWDPTGGLGTAGRIAALLVPGEQRNPHLSGEWVAFEDLTTGVSQVMLWRWTTGLVFVPHPSTSNQTLSDLSVLASSGLRVVYADDSDGTGTRRDVALYQLPAAVPDDGTPTPWPWKCADPRPAPARCDVTYPDDPDPCACAEDCDRSDDDAGSHHWDRRGPSAHHARDGCRCATPCKADRAHRTPVVLARLALERETCKPRLEARTFDATPYPGDPHLPVLVCVDVDHATAGWLWLDDQLLAGPGAFREDLRHLALRGDAVHPRGRIAGVIAGRPGATLVARVIADPGSSLDASSCTTGTVLVPPGVISNSGTSGSGTTPGASGGTGTAAVSTVGSSRIGGGGCGMPGGAGAIGGLFVVALLRLLRPRVPARE